MNKKYYIRVYTGLRQDQFHSISMQEAHKAYYLFRHPEERGTFENGVALIGRNIQEIKPDWNGTMGYNPSYVLQDDDWNSIRNEGVEGKMRLLIQKAKEVSEMIQDNPRIISEKLVDAINLLPENLQLN